MKKSRALCLASVLFAAPAAARANLTVEGSLGLGWKTSPEQQQPVNLMLAPGYGFLGDVVKLELGLVADLGDASSKKADVELRPMMVLKPPLLPFYARGIMALTGLSNGPGGVGYGGALGTSLGGLGLAMFLECGVLSRSIDVAATATSPATTQTVLIVEGRAGVGYTF